MLGLAGGDPDKKVAPVVAYIVLSLAKSFLSIKNISPLATLSL